MRTVLATTVIALSIGTTAAGQAPAPAAPSTQASADAKLRALYDAEWAWRQGDSGRRGDADSSGGSDRLPSIDPASQAQRLAYWEKTLAALNTMAVDQLSHEEQINAAVFRTSLEAFIANQRFRT
jgi:uncharacterized protein (DUF885 family)